MKYRFFSIPAMMPDDVQDDMNRFCAEHRVISIEKQFVQDGERSYWAICVCYSEKQSGSLSPRRGRIDSREVLGAADFVLFAKQELRHYAADEYLAGRASLSELATRTGLDVPTVMEEITQITGEDTRGVESFLSDVETLSQLHNDPELHAIAKKVIE